MNSFLNNIEGKGAIMKLGDESAQMNIDAISSGSISLDIATGIGGVPVERSRAHGAVEQATALLKNEDPVWFLLAPEGTRRKVEQWKSGFWHIARNANVPVLFAHFHYPDRRMGLGPLMMLGSDPDADMATIREHYRPFIGKKRGTV